MIYRHRVSQTDAGEFAVVFDRKQADGEFRRAFFSTVWGAEGLDPEEVADHARLISRAPEMLDALLELLAWVSTGSENLTHDNRFSQPAYKDAMSLVIDVLCGTEKKPLDKT